MGYYPRGLETATLVAIQRLFNFDDAKFEEMGKFSTKFSFILRLFIKYLLSLDKLVGEVPKIWERAGAVGNLKVIELNEKKIFNLKN